MRIGLRGKVREQPGSVTKERVYENLTTSQFWEWAERHG